MMNTAAHDVHDVLVESIAESIIGCKKVTVAEPPSVVTELDFSAEVPASVSGVLSGILADNRGISSAFATTNSSVERPGNETSTNRPGVFSNGSRLLPNPPMVATIAGAESSAVPRPQGSRHTTTMESLSVTRIGPRSTNGALGGSVKARIRELEEKAKAG
jgi:hypothetical protein